MTPMVKTMMTAMVTMMAAVVTMMKTCNEDYAPESLGVVQQRRESHPERCKVIKHIECEVSTCWSAGLIVARMANSSHM